MLYSVRRLLVQAEALELVEFFDNAILHGVAIFRVAPAGACRVF